METARGLVDDADCLRRVGAEGMTKADAVVKGPQTSVVAAQRICSSLVRFKSFMFGSCCVARECDGRDKVVFIQNDTVMISCRAMAFCPGCFRV